jgi:acetylglutamate kinase
MTRLIVKVGGAVAGDAAGRILGLAEEGHEVIVVHGAGPQITEEMHRRGIPVEFVQGRRRTSLAALEVVRESMESVNDGLCSALGDLAVPVLGHLDGLLAVPVPPLGQVGDPLPCRPRKVEKLRNQTAMPAGSASHSAMSQNRRGCAENSAAAMASGVASTSPASFS